MVADAMIDARLFRPDQLRPFFNNLSLYRDGRVLLSFGDTFSLQLEKPKVDKGYPGDQQYSIVGAKYASPIQLSDGFVAYAITHLFDSHEVNIAAYGNRSADDLFPMENKEVGAFVSRLNRYHAKSGMARPSNGSLIKTASVWRINQLMGYAGLIDSYRDKALEIELSSPAASASLLLEKPGVPSGILSGDLPYRVVGVSPAENMYGHMRNVFSQPPVRISIRNEMSNSAWNECSMKLEDCVRMFARHYEQN